MLDDDGAPLKNRDFLNVGPTVANTHKERPQFTRKDPSLPGKRLEPCWKEEEEEGGQGGQGGLGGLEMPRKNKNPTLRMWGINCLLVPSCCLSELT